MMRFPCPHCQHVLEVDQPAETVLCPACELWCRIPISDEFEPKHDDIAEIPLPPEARPYEPTLAPSEPSPLVPSDANSEELTFRLRDEPDEAEDVEFEIVEEGGARRPKRRRPRQRRPSESGFDLNYWLSPTLILLFLLVPLGIVLVVVSFFLEPGVGVGTFFMVGGGIWLAFLAAEDSLLTALLVAFVPFYSWHFAFDNFDRVALPFLVHCIGAIILAISLGMAALPSAEDSSALPTLDNSVTFCPAHRAAQAVFRPV